MGGMMGTPGTVGAWIVLWILLAIAVGVTGGFLITHALHTRLGAEPPQAPPTESPAGEKPKMPCACGTPTARSAGRTTCKAKSNWKTDPGGSAAR
jgi:hypothetical protein